MGIRVVKTDGSGLNDLEAVHPLCRILHQHVPACALGWLWAIPDGKNRACTTSWRDGRRQGIAPFVRHRHRPGASARRPVSSPARRMGARGYFLYAGCTTLGMYPRARRPTVELWRGERSR